MIHNSAMGRTLIIAEAGVNHNGSLPRALEMVEAAAAAGADAVKFQTFRTDDLVTAAAPKAAYQTARTDPAEGQREMLRRLELPDAAFEALSARCGALGVMFLSTPFDLRSLSFLVRTLGVRRLKLSSGDLTNGPLLLAAAQSGLPLILSTGMASLEEIEEALALTAPAESPARAGAQFPDITLLQCTSAYPAPFDSVNLRAMQSMAQRFGIPVGFSDHTTGITAAIAAVALGATVVEKHFTLDRGLPGPDHVASLEPAELAAMVRGIREVEQALGDGIKAPAPAEHSTRLAARRSLTAVRTIAAGEVFDGENIAVKRPGSGLSPMRYWDLMGRRSRRAYAPDCPIDPGELA